MFIERKAAKKDREILVIEQRRAHQINIMLGGMKHTNPEIRFAVLRMDSDSLTLVQITNLIKFIPEAGEVMDHVPCYQRSPAFLFSSISRPLLTLAILWHRFCFV